jgi:hypothetical protein
MKQMPFRTMGRAMALGLCLFACASCGTAVRQGRGSSYLVIDALEGARGGETAGEPSFVLESDVITKGTVYEDAGHVTLRASMKDPLNPAGATTTNEITITSYHVSFTRADGLNTPGVDLPYGFDSAATATVKVDSAIPVQFVLVRVQAKLEPPLMALRGTGGKMVISTIAQVTFYGHDQAGNQVSVTGTIGVNFADWGDPK